MVGRFGTRRIAGVAAATLACGLAGCGSPATGDATLGRGEQAFINGADHRLELYEVDSPAQRSLVARSVVALMDAWSSDALTSGAIEQLPTHGEQEALCEGQRFAEQPAAAFCSGVLVDWNLVLTAGHCHNRLPLEDLRVAFGYYLDAPDQLALRADDVYSVRRVVTAQRDPSGSEDTPTGRLDYAWLELDRVVREPRGPAVIHVEPPALGVDEPIVTVGSSSGVPLKIDPGGRVRALRDTDDYFVADTDTSGGWSGGGAFDQNLALVGNLARGERDFELSDDGCQRDRTREDPEGAQEEFNLAHRAVAALCETGYDSQLCDADCTSPCGPAERPMTETLTGGGGCSTGPAPSRTPAGAFALAALAMAAARRRGRMRSERASARPAAGWSPRSQSRMRSPG